jgi:hypothetical protein
LRFGEKLRYAALIATGLGLTQYAPYCIILRTEFQRELRNVACWVGDSVCVFCSVGGKVEGEKIRRNLAPFSHRQYVAGQAHAGEISEDPHQWFKLLPGDKYIEIVFCETFTIDNIERVRTSSEEYNRMWEMAFADFTRRLDEAGRALVQDFVNLRRAVVEGRIRLEVEP